MTSTIDISSLDRPEIIITRLFDAPRLLVWTAITDPKHVALWYGGPGFYRGRWTGGGFGPCWTETPIGEVWNCGR